MGSGFPTTTPLSPPVSGWTKGPHLSSVTEALWENGANTLPGRHILSSQLVLVVKALSLCSFLPPIFAHCPECLRRPMQRNGLVREKDERLFGGRGSGWAN